MAEGRSDAGRVLGAYGFAVFVAAMALSLAHRFTRVYGELDALRVDLSARVEERTTELAVARDEAQHASAAKSQFLAHMSHEIRTPMNGVLGLLELLQSTSLGDRQRHYLQTARGSADTLLRILDDVLDLSSIEAAASGATHLPRAAYRRSVRLNLERM